MVLAARVLGRARLARHQDLGEVAVGRDLGPPRGARGHHRLHALADHLEVAGLDRDLLRTPPRGRRRDARLGVGLRHHEVGRHQRAAVADGRRVACQLQRARTHVALPDAEVDGVARPPARREDAVVVRRVRDEARVLVRDVERRQLSEAEPVRPVAPPVEVHPDAARVEFVDERVVHQPEEERVAGHPDRVTDGDVAVRAAVAPVEPPEHVAAAAEERRVLVDHALLECDGGHERLPRRARRQRRLGGPVEVRLLRIAVEEVHLGLREAVAVDRQVEVGRGHHRDDAARLGVHHHRPAALVDEQALGERLHRRVDGQRQREAGLRRHVLLTALVALDLHAVDVPQHERPSDAATQHRLVLGLDARLADPVAEHVALLAHLGQLLLADLVDEAERMREPRVAVVAALLVLPEVDPPQLVLVFLKPGERPERHVLQQHVLLVRRPLDDLVVPGLHLLQRQARQLRDQRQVRRVEVARRDRHAHRRLVVDQQEAVAVEDVAPCRADDLGLDGVARRLGLVLLLVDDLHLHEPPPQEHDEPDDEPGEDVEASARVVAGGLGEDGGHTGPVGARPDGAIRRALGRRRVRTLPPPGSCRQTGSSRAPWDRSPDGTLPQGLLRASLKNRAVCTGYAPLGGSSTWAIRRRGHPPCPP